MMNKSENLSRLLWGSAVSLLALPLFTPAADNVPKAEVTSEIKVMRHGVAPVVEKDVQVFVSHASHHMESMEPVTFLGVETARVSVTLTEQLGLDRGIGLVVQRVVPETAASDVLKKHDILTKLDDQLLVSSDQLGVLVRSKDAGTEVILTFIRGGKTQTAKVKLHARENSPHANIFHLDGDHDGHSLVFHDAAEGHMEMIRDQLHGISDKVDRVEVERILSGLGNDSKEGFAWVSADAGPVVKMLSINNGNVMFSDEEGAIELKTSNGKKVLVVKSLDGKVLFDGPVTTDDERKALGEAVRIRLQKVEGLDTMEFQTGENFETDDVRVLGPKGGSVRVIRRGENHPIAVPSSGA